MPLPTDAALQWLIRKMNGGELFEETVRRKSAQKRKEYIASLPPIDAMGYPIFNRGYTSSPQGSPVTIPQYGRDPRLPPYKQPDYGREAANIALNSVVGRQPTPQEIWLAKLAGKSGPVTYQRPLKTPPELNIRPGGVYPLFSVPSDATPPTTETSRTGASMRMAMRMKDVHDKIRAQIDAVQLPPPTDSIRVAAAKALLARNNAARAGLLNGGPSQLVTPRPPVAASNPQAALLAALTQQSAAQAQQANDAPYLNRYSKSPAAFQDAYLPGPNNWRNTPAGRSDHLDEIVRTQRAMSERIDSGGTVKGARIGATNADKGPLIPILAGTRMIGETPDQRLARAELHKKAVLDQKARFQAADERRSKALADRNGNDASNNGLTAAMMLSIAANHPDPEIRQAALGHAVQLQQLEQQSKSDERRNQFDLARLKQDAEAKAEETRARTGAFANAIGLPQADALDAFNTGKIPPTVRYQTPAGQAASNFPKGADGAPPPLESILDTLPTPDGGTLDPKSAAEVRDSLRRNHGYSDAHLKQLHGDSTSGWFAGKPERDKLQRRRKNIEAIAPHLFTPPPGATMGPPAAPAAPAGMPMTPPDPWSAVDFRVGP